jgi:hypothetical protein
LVCTGACFPLACLARLGVGDHCSGAKFNNNKGPAAQLLFLCMSGHIVGGEIGSGPMSRAASDWGCSSGGGDSWYQKLGQNGFPTSPFSLPSAVSSLTLFQDPKEGHRSFLSPRGHFLPCPWLEGTSQCCPLVRSVIQ